LIGNDRLRKPFLFGVAAGFVSRLPDLTRRRHFSASRKAEAERYATDPAHRAAIRGEKKLSEK
jgi:hypothetical protein